MAEIAACLSEERQPDVVVKQISVGKSKPTGQNNNSVATCTVTQVLGGKSAISKE